MRASVVRVTLPTLPTVVLYPSGAVSTDAQVVHVERIDAGSSHGGTDGRLAIVLDRTACHPVDAAWPDQGADRAVLRRADEALDVLDCVVGATDGDSLHLGADIPVRKGTEGWTFVVVHLVDAAAALAEGDSVTVEADATYRAALSAGHSGCHLASLALNAALATAWSKEPRIDGLGSPDFDGTAIDTSTILENGSRDVYRIGKSVRRQGFDPAALDDPAALTDRVNDILASWAAAGGDMRVARDGDGLTDRRYWIATLPDGEARIPCGGTHASSLADVAPIVVSLTTEALEGAIGMTMETRVG